MDEYTIFIRDGRRKTYRFRDTLTQNGFRFADDRREWSKKTDSLDDVHSWTKFGRRHGLSVTWQNERFTRGNSYRKAYFSHYAPAFGDRYLCVYCGLPIGKDKVQVDHIYPVHMAKQNPRVQRRMTERGWDGVNDYRNLGASCARCNRNKSDKTGLWVLRGRIGQHKGFQIARWCVRGALLAAVIVFIIYVFCFL